MFVAIRESYVTSARGDVKVIKQGQTITPAQYRKLTDHAKTKFQEVVKQPKVKVSKETELERLAHQVLAELLNEHQLATSTVDFEQYSNVLPTWQVK